MPRGFFAEATLFGGVYANMRSFENDYLGQYAVPSEYAESREATDYASTFRLYYSDGKRWSFGVGFSETNRTYHHNPELTVYDASGAPAFVTSGYSTIKAYSYTPHISALYNIGPLFGFEESQSKFVRRLSLGPQAALGYSWIYLDESVSYDAYETASYVRKYRSTAPYGSLGLRFAETFRIHSKRFFPRVTSHLAIGFQAAYSYQLSGVLKDRSGEDLLVNGQTIRMDLSGLRTFFFAALHFSIDQKER